MPKNKRPECPICEEPADLRVEITAHDPVTWKMETREAYWCKGDLAAEVMDLSDVLVSLKIKARL